jgi:pimeloyl-ACP methyl ester carboxylesterase
VQALLVGLAVVAATLGALALWNQSLARKAEREFPPRGRFLTVDGVRLHYVEAGRGRPILLLHGANGSSTDFAATILPALAERGRAVAVDRPGHGWSERPAGRDMGPGAQMRLLRLAARELGLERPLLVAFSWSGAPALAWALEHGEELSGLVLLAGVAYDWGTPVDLKWRMPEWPLLGPLIVETASLTLGRLVLDVAARASFAPDPPPPAFARGAVALALRPASFRANAEDVRALKPFLAAQSPRYASLRTPILIVHGDADGVVGLDVHSRRLAREAPNVELTVLPQAGHLLPYAHPEAVLAAIDRALARTEPDG